jgi:hypothetical protein
MADRERRSRSKSKRRTVPVEWSSEYVLNRSQTYHRSDPFSRDPFSRTDYLMNRSDYLLNRKIGRGIGLYSSTTFH